MSDIDAVNSNCIYVPKFLVERKLKKIRIAKIKIIIFRRDNSCYYSEKSVKKQSYSKSTDLFNF
jgi:hypothetical protein